MKVLIVDDNAETRSLIKAILVHKGHEVVGEAGDGPAALKAYPALRPDVVLLDIIMPGMTGVQVLEELRRADPEAKVVMVTAVEQDEMNRRLLLIGAAGIIYKPFSSSDFDKAFHAFAAAADRDAGNEQIKRLAAGGLSRCMLRTSDVSAWTWELCGVEVGPAAADRLPLLGDFGADAAAVLLNVREGAPLSAALVFRSGDAGLISGALAKEPLYRTGAVKNLEESLLMEIGSIILNALLGPLIGALKRSAIPSVPMLVKGGPPAVAAALCACMGKAGFRAVSASLAMRRDGRVTRAGVVCVMPEALAAELAAAGQAPEI